MVEMNGIEPSTSCLPDKCNTPANEAHGKDLDESESDRCTNGCTKTPETAQPNRLEALADALRNLTADEQTALWKLLDAPTREGVSFSSTFDCLATKKWPVQNQ